MVAPLSPMVTWSHCPIVPESLTLVKAHHYWFHINSGRTNFSIPVTLVGIDIDISNISETSSFQPTPEEKRRLDNLNRQIEAEREEGNTARVAELTEERSRVHNQCVRPGGVLMARGVESAGRTLSDGTKLHYYRRDDGALIRQVTPPDGQAREYIVNWKSDILRGREHLPWEEMDEWIPKKGG